MRKMHIIICSMIATSALVGLAVQPAMADESLSEQTLVIDQALDDMGQSVGSNEIPSANVGVSGDEANLATIAGIATLSSLDADASQMRIRSNGVQALTVLDDGDSAATFSLEVPNGVSVIANGGGYDLVLQGDGASISVAQISKPWAVDAEGNSLSTSYSFSNGVITQSIIADGAVYPVVVDPLVTVGLWNAPYGPGFYVNLTGLEMKAIAIAAATLSAGSLAALCTASNLPLSIAKLAKVACFVGGSVTVRALVGLISKIAQNGSFANGSCYQSLLGSNKPFVKTARANCG